jgi:hypothetical protein
MENQLYYGLKGLQEILKCSTPSAIKYLKSGKIPYSEIGKTRIFSKDEVLAALKVNQ